MSESIYCQRCGGETRAVWHEGRERPRCLRCGAITFFDPKLAVAVVIVRGQQILLGRRGPGAREAGKWSLPAGFVERGEVVEAAARREVEEEVGLLVELGELAGIYSYPGEEVVLAVFVAERFRGNAAAGDDLDDVGWFGADDLPDLAFPHDLGIIQDWINRSKTA